MQYWNIPIDDILDRESLDDLSSLCLSGVFRKVRKQKYLDYDDDKIESFEFFICMRIRRRGKRLKRFIN